jgi:flagellar basal body-associated protein FliL
MYEKNTFFGGETEITSASDADNKKKLTIVIVVVIGLLLVCGCICTVFGTGILGSGLLLKDAEWESTGSPDSETTEVESIELPDW